MYYFGLSLEQLKVTLEFTLLITVLCVTEYVYIAVARRYGVLDLPNSRSSHKGSVVRGGLIIFPLSLFFCYFLSRHNFLFTMGLTLLAGISFLDDFRSVNARWRLFFQVLSALCIVFTFEHPFFVFPRLLWLLPLSLFIIVGVINAFNFMDGINGMTVAYALLTLITLFVFNYFEPFVRVRLFIYSMVPLLIFAPLNFRRQAISFPGDVGAVSIGYLLIFMLYTKIFLQGDPYWLILLAVYGVDSGLTILYRLYKREPIMQPHRQHLFQLLANELHMPHLMVTSIYIGIQALINVGFWFLYPYRAIYSIVVLASLVLTYVLMKKRYGHLLHC